MTDIKETLLNIKAAGNYRTLPSGDRSVAVDMSSNDYLGLATRTDLQEAFFADAANRALPMTSSASRLLAGVQHEYHRLEDLLEDLYHRPALLFNSGYHANLGIIQALASDDTLIVADKLVHASIIDGIVLSRRPFYRFRHNDYLHLNRILEKEAAKYDRVIVVTESVFSMDGDGADIPGLVSIKRRYGNLMLYVDEAHAVGVVGPQGLGCVVQSDALGDVDVVVGTFGKALASVGAFATVSPEVKEYLVNKARSLIFSTAISPMSVAWTRHMLTHAIAMDAERQRLSAIGQRLSDGLSRLSGKSGISSHIQPFIVGDARRAVELSQVLERRGYRVLPIRTPTVPKGTERLRISLSAALTDGDVDGLLHEIGKLI
ncbi:MAG: 8-amino-7-oxononanoate synthase [Pseudoflavonifractor sp.]|nr:8-amino-7-oxononanoate synthase [Pseudoflavonifractor sp.]